LDAGALGAGIFADAVYRIVVIKNEHITAAFTKGVGFPHYLQCAAGVLGEDTYIFFW
jgi:hypothetical protein